MSKRRFALLGLLPLAVVAAVWLLIWAPRSRELTYQEARIAELQLQQQQLQHRVGRAQEFAQGDGPARLETALAALPDGTDIGAFVTEHEEMARSAGVTVLSFAPVPVEEDSTTASGLGEVEVSLSVLGERAQVIDYASRLDELSRLTQVQDIGLTTEGDGRTSASIRALVYHLPE